MALISPTHILFTLTLILGSFCTPLKSASASTAPEGTPRGKLTVITGPMCSGKTSRLIIEIERHELARKKALTLMHQTDTRSGHACILSRRKESRAAIAISNEAEATTTILAHVDETIDVVAADEIQFFPKEMLDVIEALLRAGKSVIVSGLACDFRHEGFGIAPELLARADFIIKLVAVCVQCGKDANYSQRLIDGRPAPYGSPIILVEGSGAETYEPRCEACFVCKKA